MKRLPRSFYERPPLTVARELLGTIVVHEERGRRRAGIIVETEAYLGERDLASHASKGRTKRTDVMFGPAGHAYVYLIYGMHFCMNAVTGRDGHASAVLLRGIEPVEGIDDGQRTDGPGRLTRALAITMAQNRADLCDGDLFLAAGEPFPARRIARGPRIGVQYAKEWADKPYRFWVRDHPGVSRPRS